MEDNRSNSFNADKYESNTKTYDSRGFALHHNGESSEEPIREKRLGLNMGVSSKIVDKEDIEISRRMQKDIEAVSKPKTKQRINNVNQPVPIIKKAKTNPTKPKVMPKSITSVPDEILDNCYKIYETNKNLKKKVEQLKDQINVKTAETEVQKLENDRKQFGHETILEENDYLRTKVKALEKQILELKNSNNSISIKGLNETHLKMENEYLRQDVRKILDILKSTAEYEDFANMYDRDSNIRYLNNITHNRSRSNPKTDNKVIRGIKNNPNTNIDGSVYKNLLGVYLDEYKLKSTNDNIDFSITANTIKKDKAKWVPEDCYDFMKGIQKQAHLSDSLIEYILYELNCKWQERERDIIKYYKRYGKASKKLISSSKLPSNEKDKLITQLRNEIVELQSKVKGLKNFSVENNKFEKLKEETRLEKELKDYQVKNSMCRKLKTKANLLEKINKYLTEACSRDNMAKYYKIEGMNEYSKKFDKMMQNVKKDVIDLLERNLENTFGMDGSFQESQTMHRLKVL